jgi:hypothetical protein
MIRTSRWNAIALSALAIVTALAASLRAVGRRGLATVLPLGAGVDAQNRLEAR